MRWLMFVAANLCAFFHAIATTGHQARAVPHQAVTVRQGKAVRAELAAMLYEQGRVLRVGDPRRFRLLEDECVEFDPRRPSDGQRCDRMDVLGWGLLALCDDVPAGQWRPLDDADVWDLADELAFDAGLSDCCPRRDQGEPDRNGEVKRQPPN